MLSRLFGKRAAPERRDMAGYTDAQVNAAVAAAAGSDTDVAKAAAVEFGVGLIARAFLVAAVNPPLVAVDGPFLAQAARSLLLRGNAVYGLSVDTGGRIRLTPASAWDVQGGPDPDTWIYDLSIAGPSRDDERRLPHASVIHVRLNPTPATPWAGCSPLETAGLSSKLLALLERRLSEEAGARVGHLLPVPEGLGDDAYTGLVNDLKAIAGNVALVESAHGGMGQHGATPGLPGWRTTRFGADIPAPNIELRRQASADVLGMLGVPPGLLQTGDGAASRESFRQLLVAGVQPIADLIAAELREKLERPVTIGFGRLAAVDIAARARAYKGLIEAGMEPERAETLAGLGE